MGTEPLFELGCTVATPAALAALEESQESGFTYLTWHLHGRWGDLTYGDMLANEYAVKNGGRVLSAYRLKTGTRIHIITDAAGDDGKRASTCVRLPSDY
jgi:hypothetical protein